MKLKYVFLLSSLLFAILLNSCNKKSNTAVPPTTEVSPSDPNEVAKILSFTNATVVIGATMPASSPASEAPILTHFDNNVSYTAGSKIYIPITFSANSKLAGSYIQVKGASTYADVPVSVSSSQGTVSIPFTLPSTLAAGTFTLVLKFYDLNKKVSQSSEISIRVTKSYKCGVTKVSGGEGLTSTLFIIPSTAGKIKINYDTYVVKDKIDVFQNGTWIGGTGPSTVRTTLRKALDCSLATVALGYVGKKDEFIFDYNPANGTEIEVVVSGCEDGGTKWEYTFSCPGNFTPSVNLDLNGKWLTSTGNGITISGNSATFYSFNPTWKGYESSGLVTIGDLSFKNISKVSTYKWNCLNVTMWIKSSVPQYIIWSYDGVITMSNDGKSFTVISNYNLPGGGTSNGNSTFYRQ